MITATEPLAKEVRAASLRETAEERALHLAHAMGGVLYINVTGGAKAVADASAALLVCLDLAKLGLFRHERVSETTGCFELTAAGRAKIEGRH